MAEIKYTAPNTGVAYMYRDGNNYKTGDHFILSGIITEEEIALVKKACDEEKYFIPSQLGIPNLQLKMQDFPSDEDHVWNEFTGCFDTNQPPTPWAVRRFKDIHGFVKQFCRIKAWDVAAACKRLGLKVRTP